MKKYFESLSFKYKIIVGFATLSALLIFGMGYMLFEFTKVANIGTDIIERHQPVTTVASKALKHAQSARNQLHKYVLTDGEISLDGYSSSIKQLRNETHTLSRYAEDLHLMINKQQLERSDLIIDELNKLTIEIVSLSQSYEENHPIITSASSLLNPLALEYLGMINQIIDENAAEELPTEAFLHLANMRHSWSQMMSHLRISLATHTKDEMANVSAYIDVNRLQTERLRAMDLDLGFEGIDGLMQVREEYLDNLDRVMAEFDTSIWRRDAHLMATRVMPLYDELESYLNDIANAQLVNTEAEGTALISELSTARYIYIALMSMGLVFAFFISIFITRSLNTTLKKLVVATQAVAKGDLATKIELSGHDEIAQLTQSFNDMVRNLRESQSSLKTALHSAEQASEAKSTFLSSMSHELRTPLNAILGFSQLLEMDLKKKQAAGEPNYVYQNYAQRIQQAGEHLLSLINDVLDLSRIEEGHLNLNLVPVPVHEIVHECLNQIEVGLATKQHITLIDHTGEKTTTVLADRLRLSQVLINLLSNAVKYNQENGSVTIESILKSNNTVRLSITDTGAGIADDDINVLFDPFERLSFNRGAIEGTGIGLTVTRQLIEAMGGEIGVDSIMGKGSTFWIELPACDPDTDVMSALLAADTHQAGYQPELKSVKKKKVLCIEDNPASAQLVMEALEKSANYDGLFASTAEEGLSIVEKQNPDIILMDINLPGIDGYTALKILRNHDRTRNVPIIAITAKAMRIDIQQGKAAGFNDYITKPINIAQLYSVIDRY